MKQAIPQSVTDTIVDYDTKRGWDQQSLLEYAVLAQNEMAEFSEQVLFEYWLTKEGKDIPADMRAKTQEELWDTIWYCLSMAHQLDMDIVATFEKKLEKLKKKYPEDDYTSGQNASTHIQQKLDHRTS